MALPEWLAPVNKLLKDHDMEPNVKFQKIAEILVQHKAAEFIDNIPPTRFLPHPGNRGGNMVNWHDMAQSASVKLRSGFQLGLIGLSICFELPRDPTLRAAHLKKISDLIDASDGYSDFFNRYRFCLKDYFAIVLLFLSTQAIETTQGHLAPITGDEKYLAIATTHTVYWCKSVLAQCKCSLPDLGDGKRYSLEHMLAGKGPNHPLEIMCKSGWRWLVVHEEVEQHIPALPMRWSGSMNSTHAGNNQKLEMESALELCNSFQIMGDWVAALGAVAAGEPACKDYLGTIFNFCKTYGGGDTFPIVRYLAAYSSLWSASLKLGADFTEAVTNEPLQVGSKFPLFRAGMIAAQLTSPKHSDSVAKLLTVSDIRALKSKDKKQMLFEAESLMAGACFSFVFNYFFLQKKNVHGELSSIL